MAIFEIAIERVFCAAHAIDMNGVREPLHGHNWRVRLVVGAASLDADGLLLDFHALEQALDSVLRPFQNVNLNDIAPFHRVNPTAERIAEYIGLAIAKGLASGVDLVGVSVTEAPGCEATYRP